MNHEESKLQQQCVSWFRAQYPQYAMLLTHMPNEGNGNRVTGAIRKAEGVSLVYLICYSSCQQTIAQTR